MGKLSTELQEFKVRHGSETMQQAVTFAMTSGYSLSEVAVAMTKMASAGIDFAQAMGAFGAAFSALNSMEGSVGCKVRVDYCHADDTVAVRCIRCEGEMGRYKRAEVVSEPSVVEAEKRLQDAIFQHKCRPLVRLIRV